MNQQETIIRFATPVFFLLIGLELLIARRRGRRVYRLNDALNSLTLGVFSQVAAVFTKLLTIGIYAWCAGRLALWHLPADSLWVWAGALLAYDFCYYWLHRAGHEVNLLWAAHVVHHQSECYNLSTALRQTSSGMLLGWLFYLPLAIAGVPVRVFAVVALIDLLYQFWVHTELVGRLGWFDRVFCSPSNHRAHHAVNDRYLDRNYGGVLILWDRLFGTFVEEDDRDPPVYGTRAPLRSWNPLWANLEVYWATVRTMRTLPRWRDRLLLWVKPPGWLPAGCPPRAAFDIRRAPYDPPLPRALAGYALVQFGLLLAMATRFLDLDGHAGSGVLAAYAAYLVVALSILGGLTEQRRAAFWLELLRLAATALVPLLSGQWFGFGHLDVPGRLAFAALSGGSALWLAWSAGAARHGPSRPVAPV